MAPLVLPFMMAAAAATGLALWLNARQAAHVIACRDRTPADFAEVVPVAEHRKAADYTVAKARLAMSRAVVDLALTAGWILGGIDRVSDGVASVFGGGSIAAGVALLVAISLIGEGVTLPFALYRTFVIEARFGFNQTSGWLFLRDGVVSLVLNLGVTVPLLAGTLWLMGWASGPWWLYAWIGLMGFALALMVVYPIWLAPLFNRFTPLPDGALRDRVEALMTRCGFRVGGLFVMDASRRSSHGNAYFTGFGRAKRIVFYDTLIARHGADEIEAVLGHELGHFVHRHVLYTVLRLAAVSFAGFWALGYLAKQTWFTAGFGLVHGGDAQALVLFMLCLPLLAPLVAPIGNGLSRRAEFQADAFARRMVAAEPLIRALVSMSRDSAATLTPDPLYALFYYSHPPVPVRVARLRRG
jgi:STE24 endopeptidase